MSESKQPKYLKDRVRLKTRAILVAGAALLAWVNLGSPTGINKILDAGGEGILWNTVPSLLALFVMVLDSLPGERVKAALVFWRAKNALPGCRAFEKDQLDRDARISKDRLREFVGGTFPRAPEQQNRLWYRLYRSVEHEERVSGLHSDYLVLRDTTWFVALLAMAATSSLYFLRTRANLIVVLAYLGAYLLVRVAAVERAGRFVSTVLAVVSSGPALDKANDGLAKAEKATTVPS